MENEYEKSSRVRLLTMLHLFSNLVHFLTLIDAAFWSVKEAGGSPDSNPMTLETWLIANSKYFLIILKIEIVF